MVIAGFKVFTVFTQEIKHVRSIIRIGSRSLVLLDLLGDSTMEEMKTTLKDICEQATIDIVNVICESIPEMHQTWAVMGDDIQEWVLLKTQVEVQQAIIRVEAEALAFLRGEQSKNITDLHE